MSAVLLEHANSGAFGRYTLKFFNANNLQFDPRRATVVCVSCFCVMMMLLFVFILFGFALLSTTLSMFWPAQSIGFNYFAFLTILFD